MGTSNALRLSSAVQWLFCVWISCFQFAKAVIRLEPVVKSWSSSFVRCNLRYHLSRRRFDSTKGKEVVLLVVLAAASCCCLSLSVSSLSYFVVVCERGRARACIILLASNLFLCCARLQGPVMLIRATVSPFQASTAFNTLYIVAHTCLLRSPQCDKVTPSFSSRR